MDIKKGRGGKWEVGARERESKGMIARFQESRAESQTILNP